MSLSDVIIYGTIDQLRAALSKVDPFDQIDEYGYTPLIECLIANDTEKALLLLEAGADVNFKDMTARSPLHWAAENNNLVIAKHLLEKAANPNAFNLAAEPVMVKPLLRGNEEFIELLRQHGADNYFAYDYINAKMIGHQFEL